MAIINTVVNAGKRAMSVVVGMVLSAGEKVKSMAHAYEEDQDMKTIEVVVDGKKVEVTGYVDNQIVKDGAYMVLRSELYRAVGGKGFVGMSGKSEGKPVSKSYWPEHERKLLNKSGGTYRTYIMVCDAEGNIPGEDKDGIASFKRPVKKTKKNGTKKVEKKAPKMEEKKAEEPKPQHKYVGRPTKVPVEFTEEEVVMEEVDTSEVPWMKKETKPEPAPAPKKKNYKPKKKPVQKKPTVKPTNDVYKFEDLDDYYCFALAYREWLRKNGISGYCKCEGINPVCASVKREQESVKGLVESGLTPRCNNCPACKGWSEEWREEYRKMERYSFWKDHLSRICL